MKEQLDRFGIKNYMIRTGDETIKPDDRVKKVLNIGNTSDYVVVSNHINAGGGEGVEIIYALRNSDKLSKDISDSLESKGRDVRKYYQKRYPSDTSKDYYFIHRNTANTEPIIVEYGFLDNVRDATNLKNNWREYVDAVVQGICKYTGNQCIDGDYYIVKSGDSLWSIAKKYNTTVDELKSLNNLSNNMLSINQKLLIPTKDYYIVQKGDTLYSIAKKYNTDVDKLKDINNLKDNNLSIGQKLKMPTGKEYIVKAGDTLYSIAKKYNTNVTNLINYNNLPTTNLSIGQKLLIP